MLAIINYSPFHERKPDVNLIGDFRKALTDEETEAGEKDDADE